MILHGVRIADERKPAYDRGTGCEQLLSAVVVAMFVRTVSLIVIGAIFACPLWCGKGLCHTGSCCLENWRFSCQQPRDAVCAVHGATKCCCQESSQEQNHQGPCPCHGKSSCQGVCGGAVFENSVELDDVGNSSFLHSIDLDIPLVTRLIERRIAMCATHQGKCCGGNFGRSLRTVHMSFLC